MLKTNKPILLGLVGATLALAPLAATAQEITLESLKAETAFVFNTMLFLMGGFLVMCIDAVPQKHCALFYCGNHVLGSWL
jgi:hypothetical protein